MLPKDFIAGGLHCGIAKKKEKKDLALFFSRRPCAAAAMFTRNLVKAAPVLVSEGRLKDTRSMRAVVANSGCANACTGARGMRDADEMCRCAAKALGVRSAEVLVASTGVIGRYMPMANVRSGIATAGKELAAGKGNEVSAVEAIMTTDTRRKVSSRKLTIGGKTVTVWGCVKGSGMIHPDLALHATMLCFILTDAAIAVPDLAAALAPAVTTSFNCVTVDGDTSTNDTVVVLANGAAGNKELKKGKAGYKEFSKTLADICLDLAKMIAADGEGATHFVEIDVRGAEDDSAARKIAVTIATSPLVKTAIFGKDANWGRILAAAGRAGVAIDPDNVDIYLGGLLVARHGLGTDFSEAVAKKILEKRDITVIVDLNGGKGRAKYYTCDYSIDYIKINANYRT
jgi:glutamate N-acetyltransferase/amino-acid N-acetyltransferase